MLWFALVNNLFLLHSLHNMILERLEAEAPRQAMRVPVLPIPLDGTEAWAKVSPYVQQNI